MRLLFTLLALSVSVSYIDQVVYGHSNRVRYRPHYRPPSRPIIHSIHHISPQFFRPSVPDPEFEGLAAYLSNLSITSAPLPLNPGDGAPVGNPPCNKS